MTDERSQPPSTEPDDAPGGEATPSPDQTPSTVPDGTPGPDGTPSPEHLREVAEPAVVRRAPRYRAFVQAGAVVGVLVAIVLVLAVPGDQPLGRGPVLVFLGLTAVLVAALLGAVVAVLVDRSTRR